MGVGDKHWHYIHKYTGSTVLEIDMVSIAVLYGMDAQGLWILGTGGSNINPGRQTLYFFNMESSVFEAVSPKAQGEAATITSMTLSSYGILRLTFSNDWMYLGLRKL